MAGLYPWLVLAAAMLGLMLFAPKRTMAGLYVLLESQANVICLRTL